MYENYKFYYFLGGEEEWWGLGFCSDGNICILGEKGFIGD